MSIASELTRLSTTKELLRLTLNAKGRNVDAAASIDTYPSELAAIETGGGSGTVITPKSTVQARAMDNLKAGDTCYVTNGAATVEYEANQSSMSYPADVPADNAIAFNLDDSICAMAIKTSPYIQIYDTTTNPWTKLQSPDVLPTGQGNCIAFNCDGSLCAVGHETSPYITIYDTTSIPWTKIANPDVLPARETKAVAFSHSNRWFIAASIDAAIVYDTRSIPFVKDVNNSKSDSAGNYASIAFSPDDMLVAISMYWSRVYSISNATFVEITSGTIGTSLASISYAAFNKNGTIFAYLRGGALKLYDTTTSPWTAITNPASLPPGAHYYSLCFSPDGKFFAIGGYDSPYYRIFDTTTTPWTLLSSKVPNGKYGNAVAFDNQMFRFVVLGLSPYITIYNFQPTTPLAYPAQEATSINPSYGYATEDIASGETGDIAVLFN